MKFNIGRVINLSSLYASFQAMHDKRRAKGKRYALETIMLYILGEIVRGNQVSLTGLTFTTHHRAH